MIQFFTFWLVLGGAAAVFWLLPRAWRIPFLAIVSATYIIILEPLAAGRMRLAAWSGLVLLAWTAAFYLLAPLAARIVRSRAAVGASRSGPQSGGVAVLEALPPERKSRPWVLPVLVLAILAYLAVFKYILPNVRTGARSIAIPLGISYFTFKFIHYAVEIARGTIKDRSPWQFLCYMFMFPPFSAGPIERFDHFLANQESRFNPQSTAEGLTRIVHGLIKKFIIAEMIIGPWYLPASAALFKAKAMPTTWHVWTIGFAAYLYLYMDFAALTDIAVGAMRLFGIRIMENFDWPILAPNIGSFWKRWHMSLAGWCQAYIYMPVMGYTRSTVLALYSTFIAIGLWHQASAAWLAWGAYHATGILIFQYWSRFKRKMKWTALDRLPLKYVGIPMTFLFVTAGEVMTLPGMRDWHDTVRLMAKLVFIDLKA